MKNVFTASLLVAFLGSCQPRAFNQNASGVNEVKRNSSGDVVYVDTHDSYAFTSSVDKAAFGKYFGKVNGKNVVSLTFDCAWVSSANGNDILDALKRNNIKSTFFISGPFVNDYYKKGSAGGMVYGNFPLIKRMIDEGHEFANHSTTHPHNGDNPDWTWEMKDLVVSWNATVKKIYGENPPANAALKNFWRAPYGEYNSASLTTVAAAGFPYHFGWNVDVRDTTDLPNCKDKPNTRCLDPEKLSNFVIDYAARQKYDLDAIVVLAHLSNYYMWGKDPKGLDRLASHMRGNGYEFARLSETFKFPAGSQKPIDSRPLPKPVGAIECPNGYDLTPIGSAGGTICTNGTDVWGPFTEAMIKKCISWSAAGPQAEIDCRSDRWAKSLAVNARGTALCPIGAEFDNLTGYCSEGDNAFGPFPAALVRQCTAAGGGSACTKPRWSKKFLRSILEH